MPIPNLKIELESTSSYYLQINFVFFDNLIFDYIFDNLHTSLDIPEKASNFLYLIVKNHVFIDGNKRIAATLFIYFLQFYNILYKNDRRIIDNNTLVAITLLIAESNPNEKQILIDLIMNFLK